MGHHVEVAAPAALSDQALWDAAKEALGVAAAAEAAAWEPRIGHALGEADLEPRTWAMVAGRATCRGAAALRADRAPAGTRGAGASRGSTSSTCSSRPPPPRPASPLGDYLKKYVSGLGSAFTRPINVTGQPAISIPLGWPDDGLPRGVQLVADYGREDVLIRVASALEAAAPWADRRPAG